MDIYFSEELDKKMENWTNKMAAEFDKKTERQVKTQTIIRKKKSMIGEDEFCEMDYL